MGDPRVEAIRQCSRCGQSAVVCVDATRYLLQGIFPSGTTYQHACKACGHRFKTESPWRTVVTAIFALIPLSLCVLMVYFSLPYLAPVDAAHRRAAGYTNWWLYGGISLAFLVMSLAIVASSVWRIIQLARNPIAPDASPNPTGRPT